MHAKKPTDVSKTFKMINSNLKLKVSIVHYRFLYFGTITFGCSALFEMIDLVQEKQKPLGASILNVNLFVTTKDSKDLEYPQLNQLDQLFLTGSISRGFQIKFNELTIDQIDFDERNNLLKFFKNMMGIKIIFNEDIGDWFDKLPLKNEITFELPYNAWNY